MLYLYGASVLIVSFFLAYIVWRKFWIGFVVLFPFLYGYGTLLVSSVYLEVFPSYIYEQDSYSFFNWASLYFLFVMSGALFGVLLILQLLFRVYGYPALARPLLPRAYLLLVILLEIVLIAHVLASGSPLLLEGVTRFQFWSEYALVKGLSVFNWLLYAIIFVVGSSGAYFLYREDRISKLLSFVVFFLAGLYFVSWGNKFSALILLFFVYFIPGLISFRFRYGYKYPMHAQLIRVGPLFVGVVFLLVVGQYERFQARGLGVGEQLVERVLILQGHVFWGGFNKAALEGGNYSHAFNEVKSLFLDLPSGESGMTFLMKVLAPAELFYSYVESGVEFTSGFPAINLVTFGLLFGAVVTAFSWLLFSFFIFYLLRLIAQGARVRLLLAGYIYLNAVVWFQRGSLDGFINWKFMLVIVLIFGIEIFRLGRCSIERQFSGIKND